MGEAPAGPAVNSFAIIRRDTAAAIAEFQAPVSRGTETSGSDRTTTSAGKGRQTVKFMFRWTTTLDSSLLQERPELSWHRGCPQVIYTFSFCRTRTDTKSPGTRATSGRNAPIGLASDRIRIPLESVPAYASIKNALAKRQLDWISSFNKNAT